MSKKRRPKKKFIPKKYSKKGKTKKQVNYTSTDLFDIFLKSPKQEFTAKDIHQKLNIIDLFTKKDNVNQLRNFISQGKIVRGGNGGFKLNPEIKTAIGKLLNTNRNYGFIGSDEFDEDIKVNVKHLKKALVGDDLEIFVFPYNVDSGLNPEGEVLKIVKRNKSKIVGKLQDSGGIYFVIPDSKSIYFDIFIFGKHINGARNGDKVIAEITNWAEDGSNKNPEGRIIEVLGRPGDNDTEMHSILAEFDLPIRFPKVVEKEAGDISNIISKEEIKKRRDFRDIKTFTIDPADAKDLDDALSIQKLDNGNWEIGIHIADVTHYIPDNGALEQEAQQRATSVYLVDRVVPMLPEKLSNRLCSLNPHEDKLTFSAVFELDDESNLKSEWFGRTVINCNKRFAYEDAQEALEGEVFEYSDDIVQLDVLAKKLKTERFKNGSISFETVELKFKLAEDGTPISVFVKERKDAHKLIEEFMLLANKKVAEFVYKQKKGERNTMIYRSHEPPDPEKLKTLQTFVKRFGYNVNVEGDVAGGLNKLSEDTDGKAESAVIQTFAIRSMSKAKYSTEEEGHFGLGFKHYSHFTSPIRRYPDMMCHRMLQHYLDGGKSLDRNEYENMCKHSSEMEKKASNAERASIKYKQVEYMSDAVGKVFEGMVSGVTEWGIFVELVGTGCEGMVRMADMNDDYYNFDQKNYMVIGQRSKKKIQLGDAITVKIKDTSLENRTIDLLKVS